MACLRVCSALRSEWSFSSLGSRSYHLPLVALRLMLDSAVTVILQRFLGLGSFTVPSSVSRVTSHCLLWELVRVRGANLSLKVSCVLGDLPTSGLVLDPVFHITFFAFFSLFMSSCLFFIIFSHISIYISFIASIRESLLRYLSRSYCFFLSHRSMPILRLLYHLATSSRPRGKGVKICPSAGLSVALGISTSTNIDVGTGKLTCA